MKRSLKLLLKRIIDIVGSGIGILIISPLLFLIAIAIRLDSEGSVFYIQKRMGKGGKTFRILKFRTMVVDAEYIGAGLWIDGENDPRITRVGRFLRKTSMDELPQLVNVIRGEMSLVGPRPPLESSPYDGYENYPENVRRRFEMRPGMTGLAQVTVRTSVPWEERFGLDLEYIERFSMHLDIWILMRTVVKVINREGVYAQRNI